MTGVGDDDQQSTEESMDQAGKKSTTGRRNFLITNRAERGPLQAHVHKYVNVYRTVSWKSSCVFWEISITGCLHLCTQHKEETGGIGRLDAVAEI